MAPASNAPPYLLRRRLLLVLGVLVALVVASGAGTVVTALVSRTAIASAHEMEVASRRAALLSVIVREQYIHEAHTIILRDRSHVAHHDEWVQKLGAELDELGPDVDAERAATIAAIRDASARLLELFAHSILPAIDREDWAEVRRSHDRANALVDEMTRAADALALYFDERALQSERQAGEYVRLALVASGVLALTALGLALVAGRSLWRSLSTPLGTIEAVARRVATGDREARIDPLPALELQVVANAFNRMLDALSHAEQEVVASERLAAVGRIAAGVAHEINNPIAVIRGYAKTMRDEAESASVREELTILDEEAAACQRIAEDLLVYARSPAMVPVPVRADELLREAGDRCEESAAQRSGSPPLVVEADATLIAVDPLRIRQVVVNLVSNARQASTSGVEPVVVRGTRLGGDFRIEVLDRGAGMAAEARERLFEPFYTTRRDGTGLGLAVCYGLVTAHGGTIRAESRAGGGTRLVVDLRGVVVDSEGKATEPE